MSYNPSWSTGTSGVLIGGVHRPTLADISELADAINRRRLLSPYPGGTAQDFSSALVPGSYVTSLAVATGAAPPFYNFRSNIEFVILGDPTITWLWPFADADENKIIWPCGPPPPTGYVSLFEKINGGSYWKQVFCRAGREYIGASVVNELRLAISFLIRYKAWPSYTIVNLNSPPN